MASSLLLCTLALLISTIPGYYSLPSNKVTAEGEEAAVAERVRRQSGNCILEIDVFIHTSLQAAPGSGTDQTHDIEIQTSSGGTYKASLNDLPGDQGDPGKGDLWKLNLVTDFGVPGSTCIEKSANNHIDYVAIEEDGNDGWKIDSIVTVIKKASGSFEVLSLDMDVHQWIDGDGNPITQPGVVQIFELTRV